ncbi:MAG: hypothetical protein HC769_13300 [Cyanobacteria bacterium CRU_2_1]|nr:hypothetical protein [Cyanobacteria bacterium CRU_2_1]
MLSLFTYGLTFGLADRQPDSSESDLSAKRRFQSSTGLTQFSNLAENPAQGSAHIDEIPIQQKFTQNGKG